jgi:hypothetical protein
METPAIQLSRNTPKQTKTNRKKRKMNAGVIYLFETLTRNIETIRALSANQLLIATDWALFVLPPPAASIFRFRLVQRHSHKEFGA